MTIQPKEIYRFKAISIKSPKAFFFCHIKQTNKKLKFVWKHRRTQIVKAILRKKKRAGGIGLPDFRLHYAMVLTQRQIYRSMEQIESPKTNPHTYHQSIYDKGRKNTMEKR